MELSQEFFCQEVMDMGWIDVHTHLNFLPISTQEAMDQAREKGIQRLITIGTEPKDLDEVQGLCSKWSPHVYCSLGLHPHEARLYNDELENYLRTHLHKPHVVALGEMGLDFYYNHSDSKDQMRAFQRQMALAEEYQLPVEIHTREAERETLEVLKEYSGRVGGLIHCFSGSLELARGALDCGFNISFSGIVTFKKAEALRDVVAFVPLDRMHVETDAPYLAPVPLRGRKNQPDYMLYTAQKLAEIKACSLVDFCFQMKQNARELFEKLDW